MRKPEWLTCGEILDAVTEGNAEALPEWLLEEFNTYNYDFLVNLDGDGIRIQRRGVSWAYERWYVFLNVGPGLVHVCERRDFDRAYPKMGV